MTKKIVQQMLQTIINGIDGLWCVQGELTTKITGMALDSRQVQPGDLFAAFKGAKADGGQFIKAAVQAGAVAVLCDEETTVPEIPGVCVIKAKNARLAFSLMASRWFNEYPAVIAAVTGTNGKTSTVHFCREIWKQLGKHAASVGTIGIADSAGKVDFDRSNFLTTPDPVKLRKIISLLAENGVTHMAMEASSHGLDQCRMDGLPIKIGAFSNLTRDHLDYHGTFENYLAAKMRLFSEVMEEGSVAVLNADIEQYPALQKTCEQRNHRIISYGKYQPGRKNTIDLYSLTPTSDGQQMAFEILGKLYTVNTHLIGEFQAYNLLCALGMVMASGASADDAVAAMAGLPCVPGRMERVLPGVYVDYAHTPDALEKALKVLRPYTKGKLWVVFGCGGDRDTGKRPLMGEAAARYADYVIVTDDNPRTEEPSSIRKQILQAAGDNAIEVADRRVAIRQALRGMKPGDVLLVAGKGHEKTQTVGAEVLPFDDVVVAREEAA